MEGNRNKEDTRSRRSTKEDELRLCDIFVVYIKERSRFAKGSCRLTSLERQEVWNDLQELQCDRAVGFRMSETRKLYVMSTNGGVQGDDVAKTVFRMRNGHVEVFSTNRGSGARRKLSRCGRNQMGNETILALPEGADDLVVFYDVRSKDLEACLEKKGEDGEWFILVRQVSDLFGRDVRTLAIDRGEYDKSIYPSWELVGKYHSSMDVLLLSMVWKECRLPFSVPVMGGEGLTLESSVEILSYGAEYLRKLDCWGAGKV
ncbi:hypothetical protein Tco_1102992 [Tanacetum coccineum]